MAAAGIAELVEEAGVMSEDIGAAQTAWQGGDVAGYVSTHITLPAYLHLCTLFHSKANFARALVHTLNTNTNY